MFIADAPDRVDVGKSLCVGTGNILIGKGPACELSLSDPAVSTHHARVTVGAHGVEVTDLDSTNGTKLHGHRIAKVTLTRAARIEVGKTTIDVVPLGAFDDSDEVRTGYGRLVGTSSPMQALYRQLERIETSDAPVLIGGETGTGKELIARALHDRSERASKPYVIADCASVARNLVESELFGHLRGAFTGADRDRVGAFVRADGGTIFLDEIGELPLDVQPKLLRVLETGEVKPIGAESYQRVDVRLVTATHRDLATEVSAGRFRSDLYYRVAVLVLTVPPLRDRLEDLPILCATLAEEAGLDDGDIPPGARAFFERYRWPGNVRELRNAILRVAALGTFEAPDGTPTTPRDFEGTSFRTARQKVIEEFEEAYLRDVWARTKNVSAAAREAGVDRKHIRALLKKYGLYGANLREEK